ncbi:hypothetical protein HYW44_00170 [Candidatus Daviesbacteria bacterium]|nr:hypothetical protein [Candidatus Daviesbacteria bacterium]
MQKLSSANSSNIVYASDHQTEGQRRKKVLKVMALLDSQVSAMSQIDQTII